MARQAHHERQVWLLENMMSFWVYILRCSDHSLYTGQTDNLELRISQHRNGEIPGCYTHSRRPLVCVFSQDFPTREEALAAEQQIKGWSRKKKEAMIRGDWSEVSRLARSRLDKAGTVKGLGKNGFRCILGLDLPACPDCLPDARNAARTAGQQAGFDAQTVENFALALNEAVMNVIQHGYHGAPGEGMRLEARFDGETLIFDLLDHAPPVETERVQSRPLDEIRPGGLGVHFIRSLMDDMRFIDPPPGYSNCLRLVKLRNKEASKHGTSHQ